MTARNLRLSIIALLVTSGIFHLATALILPVGGLVGPLVLFGFLYIIISFYVRQDTNDGSKSHSRNAIIAAVGACALGLVLGAGRYLTEGGPSALILIFLLDVAVIAAGAAWLAKRWGKK